MSTSREGVTLIGMPGAGKSTVGVLLSKRLALGFIDSDLLIQVREAKPLQKVLDDEGYLGLRAIEEAVLLTVEPRGNVIATGGSAVYSDAAMRHLASGSCVVWLDVPLTELRTRIRDYETRGISRRPDQDFSELFAERQALYSRHSDLRIDCSDGNQEDALERLLAALEVRRGGAS
jgi:shikimate kinase